MSTAKAKELTAALQDGNYRAINEAVNEICTNKFKDRDVLAAEAAEHNLTPQAIMQRLRRAPMEPSIGKFSQQLAMAGFKLVIQAEPKKAEKKTAAKPAAKKKASKK